MGATLASILRRGNPAVVLRHLRGDRSVAPPNERWSVPWEPPMVQGGRLGGGYPTSRYSRSALRLARRWSRRAKRASHDSIRDRQLCRPIRQPPMGRAETASLHQ
jgi:hypothetical protein